MRWLKRCPNAHISKLIGDFTDQVLSRHDSNQNKARAIWGGLRPLLEKEDMHEIAVDWSHYRNGELETETFGASLKAIKEKYDR